MRDTAPLVSFTFDDVPDSACTNGAAVLDEYNIRRGWRKSSPNCYL
jgi:peptidoglycan/xylan/chitin deacetylase (PgdA/CDA1 family)